MQQVIEEFKEVTTFPGYYISNSGQIISMRNGFARYLKTHPNSDGYINCYLFKNTIRKTISVHRLVALVWLPKSDKNVVNHKNGVRGDNRVENLEWCSLSENIYHSYTHLGRKVLRGAEIGTARLTDERVSEIRRLIRLGVPQREIAKRLKTSQTTVNHINCGRVWRHV